MARLVPGTIFRDHYHYFTQPPLTSGVAQNNCFQEHNPVSTCMNSLYQLKIFEVVLGCGHQLDIQCQKY